MPSNTTLVEDRPGILSRCWAVVYEALLGAAMCLVCGMGLLKYLEENDRRSEELDRRMSAGVLISLIHSGESVEAWGGVSLRIEVRGFLAFDRVVRGYGRATA